MRSRQNPDARDAAEPIRGQSRRRITGNTGNARRRFADINIRLQEKKFDSFFTTL